MTAAEFLDHRNRRLPISALPSSQGLDLDGAYAVESEIARLHVAAGHRAVGRKVGYASKALWRVLKIDTLVWAHMFDDTVHYCDGAGELAISALCSPRIEPEIVMKLQAPVEGSAMESVEWIALGFEVVDCPYPDWRFQPLDFVAAWGLHAALLVGPQVAVNASNIATLTQQLADFKLTLASNGAAVAEGGSKNCMRSPALCIDELARATATRGDALRSGELVSTGTLTDALPIQVGQEWSVNVAGIDVPTLCVRFV
jgi:2-oxo-3-hexenedioate decarboxylase